MAKQKIIAIYMPTDSGGIGPENRLAFRVDRDRVDLEDHGPTIGVVVHPPRTMSGAGGKSFHYEVAKAAVRYFELESPEDAAKREAAEKKP